MRKEKYLYLTLASLFKCLSVDVSKRSLIASVDDEHDFDMSFETFRNILLDYSITSGCYQIQLDELNNSVTPFIAHTNRKDIPFILIFSLENTTIEYYTPITGKKKISKEEFRSFFSGFILIPFTDEFSKDSEMADNLKEEKANAFKTRIIAILSIMVLLMLSFSFYFYQRFLFVDLNLLLVLKTVALLVALTIIGVESNNENFITRKVCKENRCHKVINSKLGNLFTWFSLGDLGVIYFLSSLICITASVCLIDFKQILPVLAFINILVLPFSLFSILYQKLKIKEWCPLCIMVMGIFWIEFFIYRFALNSYQFNIPIYSVLFVLIMHVFTFLGWIVIKENITSTAKKKNNERFIRLIKKNVLVFNGIISEKNKETILNTAYDLSIGNKTSSNKLIIVIKFGCPACLSVLNEAINICKLKPDIMHLIVRIQNKNKNYKKEKVIKSIISLCKNGNEINDQFWIFLLNNSEEQFEKNLLCYNNINIDNEVNFIYEEQQKWIDDLNSDITPIILYNNNKLPLWYEFKDVVKIIYRNSHE